MSSTILVVDDSRMIRRLLVHTLQRAGFVVVEAEDGVEALQRLAQTPDLALIVCDMNMPRMDGLDFLRMAKATGSTVPVVMITTEDEPQRVQRAKELGAKGWVVKPFKVDVVVAVARKLTGGDAARPAEKETPANGP